MKNFLLLLFLFVPATIFCQPSFTGDYQLYIDSIRKTLKIDLISGERAPLQPSDTSLLRYFEPNLKWKLSAKIILTPDAQAFDMPTSSGKTKKFKQYGIATMQFNENEFALHIYQNQAFIDDPELKDHLFIPFLDATNGEETYEGGRYLEILTSDILNGAATLDFNLCYNPYCAYTKGYNCPVPPKENRLKIRIEAGEKKLNRNHD